MSAEQHPIMPFVSASNTLPFQASTVLITVLCLGAVMPESRVALLAWILPIYRASLALHTS